MSNPCHDASFGNSEMHKISFHLDSQAFSKHQDVPPWIWPQSPTSTRSAPGGVDSEGPPKRCLLNHYLVYASSNISTRREVVEFRWDTQNTQTLPYWEYWEYMGWKKKERRCGNGPHKSVLVDINNLEIRSLFTKLSLGITLVVWNRESGSNSYQEKTRSGKHLD